AARDRGQIERGVAARHQLDFVEVRTRNVSLPPVNFFSEGGGPKQATPLPRQDPPLPEIVSDQISGDGAWMNFRFSRVLPPGGPPTPTLAAGAAASRPRWQPPSVDHDALPAAAHPTVQGRCIS